MISLTSSNAVPATAPQSPQTEAAFGEFFGEVFFGEMMKALRSTQGEVAYLGGSQGEKTFQSQLDQTLVADLAARHGGSLAKSTQGAFARSIDVRV